MVSFSTLTQNTVYLLSQICLLLNHWNLSSLYASHQICSLAVGRSCLVQSCCVAGCGVTLCVPLLTHQLLCCYGGGACYQHQLRWLYLVVSRYPWKLLRHQIVPWSHSLPRLSPARGCCVRRVQCQKIKQFICRELHFPLTKNSCNTQFIQC